MTNSNQSWYLENFLNTLIYELDKAQDMLAVKKLHRKFTYMVKDMNIELQLFPEFDGEHVRFTTARPGESGASKMTFQLGSIRDNQIGEISRKPPTHDDTDLEHFDIPDYQRKELNKLGIHTLEDLKHTVEKHDIDIKKATKNKISYDDLADIINHTHRNERVPKVSRASLSQEQGKTFITLEGENLSLELDKENLAYEQSVQFPAAVIDDEKVNVVSASNHELKLELPLEKQSYKNKKLKVALDPYAIIQMVLQ